MSDKKNNDCDEPKSHIPGGDELDDVTGGVKSETPDPILDPSKPRKAPKDPILDPS
jgi:hypothetical protein